MFGQRLSFAEEDFARRELDHSGHGRDLVQEFLIDFLEAANLAQLFGSYLFTHRSAPLLRRLPVAEFIQHVTLQFRQGATHGRRQALAGITLGNLDAPEDHLGRQPAERFGQRERVAQAQRMAAPSSLRAQQRIRPLQADEGSRRLVAAAGVDQNQAAAIAQMVEQSRRLDRSQLGGQTGVLTKPSNDAPACRIVPVRAAYTQYAIGQHPAPRFPRKTATGHGAAQMG